MLAVSSPTAASSVFSSQVRMDGSVLGLAEQLLKGGLQLAQGPEFLGHLAEKGPYLVWIEPTSR